MTETKWLQDVKYITAPCACNVLYLTIDTQYSCKVLTNVLRHYHDIDKIGPNARGKLVRKIHAIVSKLAQPSIPAKNVLTYPRPLSSDL